MKIVAEKSRDHRFALYYDYSQEKVDFCRALKDGFGISRFSYDGANGVKRWVFSDTLFVKLLKEQFPEINIEKSVLDTLVYEDASAAMLSVKARKIEDIKSKTDTEFTIRGLKKELYPYQKIGVEFLVESGGRAIIADAPGLGKTAQALAFIKHQKFVRTLVICPASVKFAWENESKKWLGYETVVIDSKTKLEKIPSSTQIWIINYDIIGKMLDKLLMYNFSCMIGDEAHMVKSPSAKRTKAFVALARSVPNVVMLTGTPLLSRPIELFVPLNIVDPKRWRNYYDYARRYCNAHQTRFGLDVSGSSNAEELYENIRKYFIRRKKEEVLKDLPSKSRTVIPVQLDGQIAKEYERAEANLGDYLIRHKGKQPAAVAKMMQAEKLAQLNVLRQLCAYGKIDAARSMIDSIIDAGEKVIVFSSFVDTLQTLKDEYGDKAVMITGQTPVNERGSIVQRFQEDESAQIFLGGIKSAGVGITLTAASNVVFLDFSWNPADHQQGEDRACRIGQKNAVSVYYITARGTIDEKLEEILAKKQKIFDQVIDGKGSYQDDSSKSIVDDVLSFVESKITD